MLEGEVEHLRGDVEGGRTVGFFYICIKDNGYIALFRCPSSKQVKTSCKTTHLLCGL